MPMLTSALCLYEQRRYPEASRQFQRALTTIEDFAAKEPGNSGYQQSVAESLAWLADAQQGEGRLEEAIINRERQISLLYRLMQTGGADVIYPQKLIPAHKGLGKLLAARGEVEPGMQQMRLAVGHAQRLIPAEPDNMKWVEFAADARAELANLLLATGRTAEAAGQAQTSCEQSNHLNRRDSKVANWRQLAHSCLMLRARLALGAGSNREALSLAVQALTAARLIKGTDPTEDRYYIAKAHQLIGDIHYEMGERPLAAGAWQAGLASLPRSVAERPFEMSYRAILLQRLGRVEEAAGVTARLEQIGYRHPAYLRERKDVRPI